MKKQVLAFALVAAFGATAAAAQQHGAGHEGHGAAATAASASLTDGEVRKVDKEAKKLTIRHGPIANIDMPAMTMVFQVQDAAILDSLKAGDKIRFQAEKTGGSFAVTRVEAAK